MMLAIQRLGLGLGDRDRLGEGEGVTMAVGPSMGIISCLKSA